LNAQRVAILDDVVTTGSTVAELAGVLLKEGVARVDVWTLARTP
jgi:predicted amidophosphoribosyltransferase